MTTEYRFLRHEVVDGITILTFTNSLLNADAVEEVHAVNASSNRQKLLLDFRSVRQMGSASLHPEQAPIGPLLELQKQMKGDGRYLGLCGMDPAIREVFCICGLDQVFEIYSEADAAVSAMSIEEPTRD